MLTFLLILLLVACGGDATPTPAPTAAPEEPAPTAASVEEAPTTAPPTDAPPTAEAPAEEATPESDQATESSVDSMDHAADPELVDILWEWERRDPNGNQIDEIIVPDPENYTLLFNENGTFNAQIDCNSANGRYATPTPGSIFMESGPSTMAACEPDSFAPQMSQMFGPAQNYRIEEDGNVLVFVWAAGGPIDYYRNAGAASEPGEEEVNSIPPDAIQLDTQGLAESYAWSVMPGNPIPPGPGGQGFPPYILLTFDGETADDVMLNNGRRMYIFPTQAYIDLYTASGSSRVADEVARLEQLIAEADTRQEPPASPMPLLPPASSFMDRWAQFSDQDFGVGSGVRYVSEAPNRQDIGPWTNLGTAYYYQGLTTDELFYVSLVWPVATESLPNTPEDAPEDVVALSTNPETYPDYLQATKDTLNALPSSDWTPDLANLDAMVASLTFPTGAEPDLTNTTWQWISTTTPVEEISVDNPSQYTILFNEDGSANIQADCNSVGASYTTDGQNINMTLGPSTLAACAPESLDQQYLSGLENAAAYFFEEGDLFIDMIADGGTMRFTAEETVDLPEPQEGAATGVVTAPDGVFIRTGPGTEYPAIGTAPFEETGEIVGVSEDGQWWVFSMPVSAENPDGIGWVSAQFVDAANAENVPVVPTPEVAPVLTGATWEWVSLTTPTGVTTVDNPAQYTILFNEDGTANIQADCNSVSANYTTDGSNINITLGATTLAACAEGSLEQPYLAALGNAAIYFFEEGVLFMDLTADSGTMRFRAGTGSGGETPPSPESPSGGAENILFNLVSFGPPGAEQSLIEGTQITATFTDTEMFGFSGCNDYSGVLTPVNDYFTVGPVISTKKACAEPAGVMEQEQAYLAALGGISGFQWQSELVNNTTVITAGQLSYTLPDGASGVLNLIAAQ